MTSNRSRALLCVSVCALGAGCPGDPPECLPGAGPTLDIGWGETAFTDIGDTVPLSMGPQGGYHTFIALRATHLNPDELVVASMTGTIDGEVLSQVDPWIVMECERSVPALEALGALLIWNAEPVALDGKTAEVDVSLRDIDGTEVEGHTSFTIDATGL